MKESGLLGFGSVEESANTEGNVFSSKESEANVSKPVGDIAKGTYSIFVGTATFRG